MMFDMASPMMEEKESESISSFSNDSLSLTNELCEDKMECEELCEKKEEKKEKMKKKKKEKKIMPPQKKLVSSEKMKKEEKVQEKVKPEKALPVVKFDLNQLIFNQNTSGSWDIKKLFQIISKDENKSKDHLNSKINEDQKKLPNLIEGWATAVAISILGKFFKDKKDEWDMIEQKAIKFLKKNNLVFLIAISKDFIETF
jgi:outer membrane biosynthesis protein TonB